MKKLTRKQTSELKKLTSMREEDIDTSDIPEIKDWSQAVVGRFYRPIKQPVTIRLDSDVVAWYRSQHGKYQTMINRILRAYMDQHQSK